MSVKDVDGHKLDLHPHRVSSWLKKGDCYPLHVEIGPTNRCNHYCHFCSVDWITHGKVLINTEALLRSLTSMAEVGVKSVYFAGEGEPTLHQDITKFVEHARKSGMGVAMSTNGHLLNEERSDVLIPNLSWIRFSIDAAKGETHSKIHLKGKNDKALAKIFDNISYAVKVKKREGSKCELGIQAIALPENVEELEDLAKICKELGVDNFQVKPAHNHPKSDFSPNTYKYYQDGLEADLMKYEDENFKVVVRTKSMERLTEARTYCGECNAFSFFALLDAKGYLYTCNIFYDKPEFSFGNINNNSFKEIWDSEQRQNVIKTINEQNKKDNHKQCGVYRCRPDVLNRHLYRVKHPEQNDEFI